MSGQHHQQLFINIILLNPSMNLNLQSQVPHTKKAQYDGSKSFRTTNLSFRKSGKPQKNHANYLTTFRSSKLDNNSKLIIVSQDRAKNIDLVCSNFMKNYVDRLKKQRKRQNKKQQNLKSNRTFNSPSPPKQSKTIPLCQLSQPNQVVLLDKIQKGGTKNTINTISIVSRDLYDISNFDEGKGRKVFTPIENPSWTKKQKLNELITDIRKSSSKELSADHILEGRAEFIQRDLAKKVLMTRRKQRSRKIKLNDQISKPKTHNKSVEHYNFKQLEPWNEDRHFHDFSIEEYGKH